jgi:hypothetical protein
MKYSMQLRVYVQAYKANLDVKSFEEALKEWTGHVIHSLASRNIHILKKHLILFIARYSLRLRFLLQQSMSDALMENWDFGKSNKEDYMRSKSRDVEIY